MYVNVIMISKSRYQAIYNTLNVIAESDVPKEPLIEEPVEENIDYEQAYNELMGVLTHE